MPTERTVSQPISTAYDHDDDDDFQVPLSQTPKFTATTSKIQKVPLKPSNNPSRPSKKPKPVPNPGKENVIEGFYFTSDEACSLESIPSTFDSTCQTVCDDSIRSPEREQKREILKINEGYSRNSVESRLLRLRPADCGLNEESEEEEEEEDTELDVLLKLCHENGVNCNEVDESVRCPLCGIDISDLNEELRQVHTNNCLDNSENQAHDVSFIISSSTLAQLFFPLSVHNNFVN